MDLISQTVSVAIPCSELSLTHGERTGEVHFGNECIGEIIRNGNCPNDDVVVNAAHFILNLKEKFKLSQVSLDFVIQSVEKLLRVSTDNIENFTSRRD